MVDDSAEVRTSMSHAKFIAWQVQPPIRYCVQYVRMPTTFIIWARDPESGSSAKPSYMYSFIPTSNNSQKIGNVYYKRTFGSLFSNKYEGLA